MSQLTPQELKARVDIVAVIGLDFKLKPIGGCEYASIEHPSLKVNQKKQIFGWFSNKLNCVGGDVFSWYLNYHNLNFHAAFAEIAHLAGLSDIGSDDRGGRILLPPPPPPMPDIPKERINEVVVTKYCEALKNSADGQAYLAGRSITMDMAEQASLGWADNLSGVGRSVIIPVYDSKGELLTIRYRAVDAQATMSRYSYLFRGYGAHLYNGGTLDENSENVFIVEGEFKTLHMLNAGYNTVGLFGATAMKLAWHDRFKTAKRVMICLDSDQNPQNIRWCNELAKTHGNVYIVTLPGKPDDLILAQGPDVISRAAEYAKRMTPQNDNFHTNFTANYTPGVPAAGSAFGKRQDDSNHVKAGSGQVNQVKSFARVEQRSRLDAQSAALIKRGRAF